MSRYRIEYAPRAEKQLKAIKDARVGRPIRSAIEALADNPRPQGCLKLVGETDPVAGACGGLADRLPDRGRAAGGGRGPGCAEEWGLWVGGKRWCEHPPYNLQAQLRQFISPSAQSRKEVWVPIERRRNELVGLSAQEVHLKTALASINHAPKEPCRCSQRIPVDSILP
jgi:hypothetical protein